MRAPEIAILLSNLRAEGGPTLAASLCAEWLKMGLKPRLILLNDEHMTLRHVFDDLGVDIQILGVTATGPRHYPKLFWRLRRELRRRPADAIVSVPNGVHGVLFAAAAAAGVRRRVVHVGNYPWHWDRRAFWKYRLLMRLAAPVTPDLVCVSEHVRDGVLAHFGRVARAIHVIPNGIATSGALPRASGSGDAPSVLMVGRLDDGKDHGTLLQAVAILRDRGQPLQLQLAGDGALRAALEGQARRLGLDGQVAFLGPRKDVPELLARADVFAFSVNAEEGQGIALLEAMAAGTPIVATDVGACREVLAEGEAGLLLPPHDPSAWADGLQALLRDPERSARLAAAALRRVRNVYDRRQMAAGYAALCVPQAAGR